MVKIPDAAYEKVFPVFSLLYKGQIVVFFNEEDDEVYEAEITGGGTGNTVNIVFEQNGLLVARTIDALDIIPDDNFDFIETKN